MLDLIWALTNINNLHNVENFKYEIDCSDVKYVTSKKCAKPHYKHVVHLKLFSSWFFSPLWYAQASMGCSFE